MNRDGWNELFVGREISEEGESTNRLLYSAKHDAETKEHDPQMRCRATMILG